MLENILALFEFTPCLVPGLKFIRLLTKFSFSFSSFHVETWSGNIC